MGNVIASRMEHGDGGFVSIGADLLGRPISGCCAPTPASVKLQFGDGVRKVAPNPFDLVYTYFPERDLVHVEALIHQRAAW